MSILKEFKDFALRGNVLDLGVAVIIGAAFGSVVSSLVKDVLMPPLGYVAGGFDFADKKYVINAAVPAGVDAAGNAVKAQPEVAVSYGLFINAAISFTIIAFAVFMIVKAANTLKRQEPAPPPPGPTKEQVLLTEIRDALLAMK